MSEPVEDREELARRAERRRVLEVDGQRTRDVRDLSAPVEELVADFAHQPEQIGYYLAEMEELGRIRGADKETLYWRIADRAGRGFADRAFSRDRGTSAGDLLGQIRAEREQARGAEDPVAASTTGSPTRTGAPTTSRESWIGAAPPPPPARSSKPSGSAADRPWGTSRARGPEAGWRRSAQAPERGPKDPE